MSHRATLYAKELRICPNGEPVSKLEKLVLYALADYHQDKLGTNTYPSVKTLAEESIMDERSCRRLLGSLERKGVIERMHGRCQGRGHVTFYRFPALDKPSVRSAADAIDPGEKGGHSAPLFDPPFLSQRGAKGGQKGDRECTPHKEEQKQEQKQIQTPPTPSRGEGGRVPKNCIPIRPDREDLDQAVDAVMDGCGFTARRLRLKLRAVVEQQERLPEAASPVEIAAAMVDAWKRYTKQGARLRAHMNAGRFFEEGYWLNSQSWHWDADTLREERQSAEARAGSY